MRTGARGGRWRRLVSSTLGALICLIGAGGLPLAATSEAVEPPGPMQIMLVGDSVTQGTAGDFTWRYRLWKTLQAYYASSGTSVDDSIDFVGPRTVLADGSTDYADPSFDQDHSALWGAWLGIHGWMSGGPEDVTFDLVSAYRPDVIVNDLGYNNLYPYGGEPGSAESLIENDESFVADARAASPGVTVIFGQLTQTWGDRPEVAAYNTMLTDMASRLTTPDALVLVAPVSPEYGPGDSYDGTHPNAKGETKIAEQFYGALGPLLPPPARPPVTVEPYAGRALLRGVGLRHRVRLTYTWPSGAIKQAIWKKNLTTHGTWRLVTYVSPGHRHVVRHLKGQRRYAFRLRAYTRSEASSAFSNLARVKVRS